MPSGPRKEETRQLHSNKSYRGSGFNFSATDRPCHRKSYQLKSLLRLRTLSKHTLSKHKTFVLGTCRPPLALLTAPCRLASYTSVAFHSEFLTKNVCSSSYPCYRGGPSWIITMCKSPYQLDLKVCGKVRRSAEQHRNHRGRRGQHTRRGG